MESEFMVEYAKRFFYAKASKFGKMQKTVDANSWTSATEAIALGLKGLRFDQKNI